MAAVNFASAQCTISNVTIAPTNVNGCVVTFNLSFDVAANGGSKHAIIHLWESNRYPSTPFTASQYPVSTAETANMLGTIIIENPGSESPVLLSQWPTGSGNFKASTLPSSPILIGSLSTTNNVGSRTFSFTGLTATLQNCTQSVTILGDVWATQNDQNASCLASRAINVIANDPVMRTQMTCSSQRSFNVAFVTLAPADITFSAYRDVNNDGNYDDGDKLAGKLNLTGPGIAGSAQDVTIHTAAGNNVSFGNYTYDQQVQGSKFAIFVVARVSTNNYDNVLRVDNGCSLLPVSFKSFTATKGSSAVSLKWTTASESNNKGFYVQRYTNGQWENVMFVATKAVNGNSQSDLNYAATDNAKISGTVQYRILQMDIDGKSKYSEIRALKGDNVAGSLLVYPNPASHGNVSIVLDNANASYNIQVIDGAGRIVKQFTNVRNAQQISGLPRGQYVAKVIDSQSGESSVEKFIMQ
jgi:hypothetical protein